MARINLHLFYIGDSILNTFFLKYRPPPPPPPPPERIIQISTTGGMYVCVRACASLLLGLGTEIT